jgi:beta-barrel assembly-enhancing protease
MKRLRALSVILPAAVCALAFSSAVAAQSQPQQASTASAAAPQSDPKPLAERPAVVPDPKPAATDKKAQAEAKKKATEEAKAANAAKAAADKKAKDAAKAAAIKNKNSRKDPDAIGDRNVGKGINLYSLEKEIGMGKQLAQEVEREAKIVDDPVIAEYVNRIGQNLVRNSDAMVPFTIKVVDSEDVNAFALPGGFFFVNTGVLLKAENEAEMAGVMAHEIAHVAARHGTKQASKSTLANLATIPLIFLGGWGGYAVRQGASLMVPMAFLQFTKAYEKEADFLGLQYLYKAGYDPTAFVDFFEKIQTLEKKKPGTMAKVFASHPMTDDRIKNAQLEIQENLKARPEYVVNTSEFNDVKNRLLALQSHRKVDTQDPNRPQLRRAPGSGADPGSGDGTKTDSDERPTLKRRDG